MNKDLPRTFCGYYYETRNWMTKKGCRMVFLFPSGFQTQQEEVLKVLARSPSASPKDD